MVELTIVPSWDGKGVTWRPIFDDDEEAFAAYEEAVAALGPVPAPPPFRDHLNDARVAADGTDGPPLFCLLYTSDAADE